MASIRSFSLRKFSKKYILLGQLKSPRALTCNVRYSINSVLKETILWKEENLVSSNVFYINTTNLPLTFCCRDFPYFTKFRLQI